MKNREKVFWVIGMFILLAGCLQSCVTLEKKIAKAKVVAYQNPNEFADVCATLYPIRETTKIETKYIPADNKNHEAEIDSLNKQLNDLKAEADKDTTEIGIMYQAKINTLTTAMNSLKKQYKPCKPDTVFKDKIIIQESTAKIKALEIELTKTEVELSKEKEARLESEKTANKRLWWLISIGVLFGVGVLLKIRGIL